MIEQFLGTGLYYALIGVICVFGFVGAIVYGVDRITKS